MATDILLEIEYDDSPLDEGEEVGGSTIFSRSSRGKRSSMMKGGTGASVKASQIYGGGESGNQDGKNVSRLSKGRTNIETRVNKSTRRDASGMGAQQSRLMIT